MSAVRRAAAPLLVVTLAAAVALPAVYSDAHPAPGSSPTQHITRYPDGALIAYDHATGHAHLSGVATATVQASTAITLDTPHVIATGALDVHGLLTYHAGLAGTGGGSGCALLREGGKSTVLKPTPPAAHDHSSSPGSRPPSASQSARACSRLTRAARDTSPGVTFSCASRSGLSQMRIA